MTLISSIMSNPTLYRLWQAPFAERKLEPVRKYNDLRTVRRVLDVGCGPGTNTTYFRDTEYLGLDWNQSYIEYARRLYSREFLAVDIRTYTGLPGALYDFILVNSFLHHIDVENSLRILSKLNSLLASDGHIHILDLVMPDRPSMARLLAQWDRGGFARPLTEWRHIFCESFVPVLFEPFPVKCFGVSLWNMVYFKGRAKT